ncbi:MAG TPA: rhomboid family intramembrane serine protease [Pilimelia sp.]|nr:rhomboid family intramembrane serine protease [Pilimelia sp.]
MSDRPATVPVCYRHPSRETYVRCSRCDRSICPDCMTVAAVGHQCPECVAEGRRTQRPARTAFGGGYAGHRGYVTFTLIGINVLMLLLSFISASGGNALFGGGWGGALGGYTPLIGWGAVYGGDPTVLTRLPDGQVVGGIAQGEYYRLLTSMFLHYGLIHLLLNMWALWVLGRNLEAVLGPLRFLGLYLLAGLGGSVAAYLFAPNSLTAGASGAIFGLFAALFVVMRRLGRDTSAIVPILVINLIFTVTAANISIAGHFGGLVVGGAVAAILAYAPRTRRTLVQAVGCGAIFLLLAVLTLAQTAALTS